MHISTFIGIIFGIVLIAEGIFMRGGHLASFWELPSLLITFGGTFAALLVNYPLKEVIRIFGLLKKIFAFDGRYNYRKVITQITKYSQILKREGPLSLEKEIPTIKEPFLKNGIRLIVDGASKERIEDEMENQILSSQERHNSGQEIFLSLGTYAPAFGMIGTIIGLILMLARIEDPAQIAGGMSVALLTTFYGATAAYLIFLPIAGKLKHLADEEFLYKQIILEGILSLQAQELPSKVESKLKSFLREKEKQKIITPQQESGIIEETEE